MSDYGFSPDRRLRCSRDFQQVFEHTLLKVHQPHFLILATRASAPQHSRLGLVVAKKKLRRAHERNRVKRLSRESFRLNRQQLLGLDIVVLPKHGIDQIDNAQLQQQLHLAWLKLARLFAKQAVSVPSV